MFDLLRDIFIKLKMEAKALQLFQLGLVSGGGLSGISVEIFIDIFFPISINLSVKFLSKKTPQLVFLN